MKLNIVKKSFRINLNVYPNSVFVCIKGDYDGLLRLLEESCDNLGASKKGLKKTVNEAKKHIQLTEPAGCCRQLGNGNVLLFISDEYINGYTVNLITHEVLHATQMILERAGIELSMETCEAYCYLNGFLNQTIFNEL